MIRTVKALPLMIACATAPLLVSAAPRLMDPPIYLSYGGQIVTSNRGFVYSMTHFTEEQMNDPRWENLRQERAQWNFCGPDKPRLLRRDVRWYDATPVSKQRCAMVVYTMECPKPKGFKERTKDDLATDREAILTNPVKEELEKDCGEKNGYIRHARSYGKGRTDGRLRDDWFTGN